MKRSFLATSVLIAVLTFVLGGPGCGGQVEGGGSGDGGTSKKDAGGGPGDGGLPGNGNCDDIGTGNPNCDDCMHRKCCVEISACLEAPDDACKNLTQCLAQCVDADCYRGCSSTYPEGLPTYEKVQQCVLAQCKGACM